MSRLVVCAGMYRSGSTWLYNTVRLALLKAGFSVYADTESKYDAKGEADWHVVKTHVFREDLRKKAGLVIMTKRDLRDVAASAIRVGKIKHKDIIPFLNTTVARYDQWRRFASLTLAYEDIHKDKIEATSAVMQHLGLAVRGNAKVRILTSLLRTPKSKLAVEGSAKVKGVCITGLCLATAVSKAVEALKPPPKTASTYDPITLLTPGHITDGGVGTYLKTLTKKQANDICCAFSDWLDTYYVTVDTDIIPCASCCQAMCQVQEQ